MRFSIITPSYRSAQWLRLCIESVADQKVDAEHIVQDAGSDDGTLDWLLKDSRVKAHVEKDRGMYDAVNRGFHRSKGEILAYLNCDEQYLPRTLEKVDRYFQANPWVDVAFGNVIMVNSEGAYMAHRKMATPTLYHTWTVHLSTLSCGMFIRRSVINSGYLFRDDLRDVGDAEWMVRVLRDHFKMGTLGEFTSVFTNTGANMSEGKNAKKENRELAQSAPAWARLSRPGIILVHRLRRLVHGLYFQKPFSYSIYTLKNPERRVEFEVKQPSFRWRL